MEYIYLLVACAFFSLQFIFQKLFERKAAGGLTVCLWNLIISCLAGTAFLVIKSGLPTQFTWGAFTLAFLTAVSSIVGCLATLTAMRYGKVSVVTTFCLAGGMILPFVFGIAALGETAGLFKWLGMGILCLSLLPPLLRTGKSVDRKGHQGKLIGYCLLVFATNGLGSILSKTHQISAFAVDEHSYLFTSGVLNLLLSTLLLLSIALLASRRGDANAWRNTFWEIGREKMQGRLYLLLMVIAATYSVCHTLGETFNLYCMRTMDASIQFPVISAVVIVMSAIFGRLFFDEKISRANALSLLMSVAGIGLLMIP